MYANRDINKIDIWEPRTTKTVPRKTIASSCHKNSYISSHEFPIDLARGRSKWITLCISQKKKNNPSPPKVSKFGLQQVRAPRKSRKRRKRRISIAEMWGTIERGIWIVGGRGKGSRNLKSVISEKGRLRGRRYRPRCLLREMKVPRKFVPDDSPIFATRPFPPSPPTLRKISGERKKKQKKSWPKIRERDDTKPWKACQERSAIFAILTFLAGNVSARLGRSRVPGIRQRCGPHTRGTNLGLFHGADYFTRAAVFATTSQMWPNVRATHPSKLTPSWRDSRAAVTAPRKGKGGKFESFEKGGIVFLRFWKDIFFVGGGIEGVGSDFGEFECFCEFSRLVAHARWAT